MKAKVACEEKINKITKNNAEDIVMVRKGWGYHRGVWYVFDPFAVADVFGRED